MFHNVSPHCVTWGVLGNCSSFWCCCVVCFLFPTKKEASTQIPSKLYLLFSQFPQTFSMTFSMRRGIFLVFSNFQYGKTPLSLAKSAVHLNGDFHSKLEARTDSYQLSVRFLNRSHLIQAHSTHPRPRKFTTSLVDLWSSLL